MVPQDDVKSSPLHIWIRQNAQYTVQNVPVFLYAATMLIFQITRIISSEKWFNYVVPSSFFVFVFFLKMRQMWVGRTTLNLHRTQTSLSRAQRKAPEEEADAKRRKKRGWPNANLLYRDFP